ncbi:MAG: adenine phosphoribosyltransferase [Acidimicrobiales bacterium]
MTVDVAWLWSHVRDVPDFPEAGISFKDITPLLGEPAALRGAIDAMAEPWIEADIALVAGIEARGFLLAAPLAYHLGAGLVPVRKPGKLPWSVAEETYALEYGTDTVQAHVDSVTEGQRVLVVDDVLATGGTASATCTLLEGLGASVVGVGVLLELGFLGGRARLGGRDVRSLLVEE